MKKILILVFSFCLVPSLILATQYRTYEQLLVTKSTEEVAKEEWLWQELVSKPCDKVQTFRAATGKFLQVLRERC